MLANTRAEIVEVLDACDAAVERLCELSFDVLTTPERMAILERLETVARRLPVPQHQLLNQLGTATKEELGDTLRNTLADRLRITRAQASRRIADAADLGPRMSLTGSRCPRSWKPPPPPNAAAASAVSTWRKSATSSHTCPPTSTPAPANTPKPTWPTKPPPPGPTRSPTTPPHY